MVCIGKIVKKTTKNCIFTIFNMNIHDRQLTLTDTRKGADSQESVSNA